MGWIPDEGNKKHTQWKQLSLSATITWAQAPQLENLFTAMKDSHDATKIPCAATKTQSSQINR